MLGSCRFMRVLCRFFASFIPKFELFMHILCTLYACFLHFMQIFYEYFMHTSCIFLCSLDGSINFIGLRKTTKAVTFSYAFLNLNLPGPRRVGAVSIKEGHVLGGGQVTQVPMPMFARVSQSASRARAG
jgi:hypothetical protein